MATTAPIQILLDVFGTVAFFGDKKRPFAQLLASAFGEDRARAKALGARLLTEPISLRQACDLCGVPPASPLRGELDEILRQEIASIQLHEDALAFVKTALSRGHRVALCSNLALPYQTPVQEALRAENVDELPFFSSFALGAAKPDPAIYAAALGQLGRSPSECFFAGDTPAADRDGPRSAGIASVLLDRKGNSGDPEAIRDFFDLAHRWGWGELTPNAPRSRVSP